MTGRTRMGPICGLTRWMLRRQQRGQGVLIVMVLCMVACAYRVLA